MLKLLFVIISILLLNILSLQTLVKGQDLGDNNKTCEPEPYHFSVKEQSEIRKFLYFISKKISYNAAVSIRLYKTGIVLYGRAASKFYGYPRPISESNVEGKPIPKNILKKIDLSIWSQSPYLDYPKFLPDTANIGIAENENFAILERWDYLGNKTCFSKIPSSGLLKALQNIKNSKLDDAYDYFFPRYDDITHSTDNRLTPFILCKNIFAVAYVNYFLDQYGTYSDSPLNKLIQAIPELFANNIANNKRIKNNVKILDSVLRYIPIEPEKDRKINHLATNALYDILDEVVNNSRDVVIIEDQDFDRCKYPMRESFKYSY